MYNAIKPTTVVMVPATGGGLVLFGIKTTLIIIAVAMGMLFIGKVMAAKLNYKA